MTAIPLSRTPDNVSIEARNVVFDVAKHLSGNWCANDAFRTDFSNALSLSFPRGEKFFVDSVRFFIAQIKDPKLLRETEGFVKQESMHRREHERYNQALCEARGYDKDHVESIYARRIKQSAALPPLIQLSITVCLEHFTALFANGLLTDPRWLEGVDPDLAKLWQWHALEEIEHKSVAYDVFLAVGGNRKMLRATMRLVTYRFFLNTFKTMRLMQKADRRPLSPISYWWRGLRHLYGPRGILSAQRQEYRRYFKDNFHPWQYDNHELISKTLATLNLNSAT